MSVAGISIHTHHITDWDPILQRISGPPNAIVDRRETRFGRLYAVKNDNLTSGILSSYAAADLRAISAAHINVHGTVE